MLKCMAPTLRERGELNEVGCQGRPPGGGGLDWGLEDGRGACQSTLDRGPNVDQNVTGTVSVPAGGGGQFGVGSAWGCRGRSLA